MCGTTFPETRSSILMPVEGGLHQLICCAKLDDLPAVAGAGGGGGKEAAAAAIAAPTDDLVLAFVDSLPDGGVTARALRAAERVSDITSYRRTENRRWRFERLVAAAAGGGGGGGGANKGGGDAAVPRGWVALGDAVVAFNPVYGQGISVGILQALLLGDLVKEALAGAAADATPDAKAAAVGSVGAPFFRRLPSVVDVPWALAAGTDAPFVARAGDGRGSGAAPFERSPAEKLLNAYFEGVVRLGAEDTRVYDELVRSIHMTRPTEALLVPDIAVRVAWRALLRAVGLAGGGGGGSGARRAVGRGAARASSPAAAAAQSAR